MINSSSLSSGLLSVALFHGIQWQTSIAIYSSLLCTYNHRFTLPHYIQWDTNTCLVSGGKHQIYTYRLQVEPEHIALLNIHFHPCGNNGCSGPCKHAYRNAHTEIQELVYLTPWIYLTLTMIHLALNRGEFHDQLWNHVLLKKDYAPWTC